MRVLHDWDKPYPSGKRAILRGVTLILYGLSKKLPFLQRIGCVKDVREELRTHADTLAMLDTLAGVEGIFGVLDDVTEKYPDAMRDLRERFDVDVRRHIHIGENKDPIRVRIWEPIDGLEYITKNVWHFDRRYNEGDTPKLLPGEIAIWHVDYPRFLKLYIEWLYKVKFENLNIYE